MLRSSPAHTPWLQRVSFLIVSSPQAQPMMTTAAVKRSFLNDDSSDNSSASSRTKYEVGNFEETWKWDIMFIKLVQYEDKYGNCFVPQHFDKKLARWVCKQRTNYENKNLSNDHIKRLESIGFVWVVDNSSPEVTPRKVKRQVSESDTADEATDYYSSVGNNNKNKKQRSYNDAWNEMCDRLDKYKDENGHCKVPFFYKEDTKLGYWVSDQRKFKKKGTLLPERFEKLDAMGFVWSAKPIATTSAGKARTGVRKRRRRRVPNYI